MKAHPDPPTRHAAAHRVWSVWCVSFGSKVRSAHIMFMSLGHGTVGEHTQMATATGLCMDFNRMMRHVVRFSGRILNAQHASPLANEWWKRRAEGEESQTGRLPYPGRRRFPHESCSHCSLDRRNTSAPAMYFSTWDRMAGAVQFLFESSSSTTTQEPGGPCEGPCTGHRARCWNR